VAGDIGNIEEYDGNLMSIYGTRNRFREEIVVNEVQDDTVCFWGYVEDDDNFEPGIITMFDSNGNEVGCSIVY
jgi:hypothetical protein